MALISTKDRDALTKMAQEIKQDVGVTLYTQRKSPLVVPGVVPCETCEAAEQLVTELGEIIPKVRPDVRDFVEYSVEAAQQDIDRVPTIVVSGDAADRVRFVGFPAGYEAAAFVQSIFEAGGATEELPKEVTETLASLAQPVHLKVFVTPT